jgi:sugar phosphate isomerase/epimerase
VTLPSAPLGTPFNEEIDRLRSRLTVASSAGLRLSLKTQSGRLTEDPQTAVELCQSVSGLGITLDVSYYLCGKYASHSHDQVYPYVYHVHLRDSSASAIQVPVGLGEVDYSRIISQLRRFDYNRVLSVEILPELLGDADRALELRKIRMLLETLL